MLLAIDAGNSNVDFALFTGSELRERWSLPTSLQHTVSDYMRELEQTLAKLGADPSEVTGAIVTSVVPGVTTALKDFCRQVCDRDPVVVGENGVDLGLEVRADQVGHDRLVNAIAGAAFYDGPLLVIDLGTASTFDIVAPDGGFEGGTIVAGPNLLLDALSDRTAQLPNLAIERPDIVIGKATAPAMLAGAYWGYVDLIEGKIARLRRETGWPLTVVATGGLAGQFVGDCPSIDHHHPGLTLEGLAIIHRRNRTPED